MFILPPDFPLVRVSCAASRLTRDNRGKYWCLRVPVRMVKYSCTFSLGLDLWTLTFCGIKVFSTKPTTVKLFAGGQQQPRLDACAWRREGCTSHFGLKPIAWTLLGLPLARGEPAGGCSPPHLRRAGRSWGHFRTCPLSFLATGTVRFYDRFRFTMGI